MMLNVYCYCLLVILSICCTQAIATPIPPLCPTTTFSQSLSSNSLTVTFTPTIPVTGVTIIASTSGGDVTTPMIPTGPDFTIIPTPFIYTSTTGSIISYSFTFTSTTGITCNTNLFTIPFTECPNLTFTQSFIDQTFVFHPSIPITSVDVGVVTPTGADITFIMTPISSDFATIPTPFTALIPSDVSVTSYSFTFTTTTVGIRCDSQLFIPNGYQGMIGQIAGSARVGTSRTTFSITPSRYQRTKHRINIMNSQ